jgi:hypothetical protein
MEVACCMHKNCTAETAVHCCKGVRNCHLQRGQLWESREHLKCSCAACVGPAIQEAVAACKTGVI